MLDVDQIAEEISEPDYPEEYFLIDEEIDVADTEFL